MTSFFRFVNKRAIYVHVIDFPVVNVHVDELSSARIWQHKLCVTYSANVNINNRLPIKVFVLLDILESLNTSPSEQLQNVIDQAQSTHLTRIYMTNHLTDLVHALQ
jgi:hypothetical protein